MYLGRDAISLWKKILRVRRSCVICIPRKRYHFVEKILSIRRICVIYILRRRKKKKEEEK